MNELIKIGYENNNPTVSARELHEFLEINTEFRHWFPRMCEYGFTENVDYTPVIFDHPQNKQATVDYQLTIDMAKELCMIQRTDRGKQARQYFISVEKEYNSPEKIMARALMIADKKIKTLEFDNNLKSQQISELAPKASYYDMILQCKDLLSTTEIAKDYGMSAKKMNATLHQNGVQFNQNGVWFLYAKYHCKGYTQSKTQNYNKSDGTQGARLHMYWTQKGRLFLYEFLKTQGILPMVECSEKSA